MEDLPKDVVFDILLRVPVRTITSCRCVCKTWRKIVSHSSFVNRHLSISRPQACLMVHQRSYSDIKKSRALKLVELSIDDAIGHHPSCIEVELGMVKRSSNTEHIIILVGSVNGLSCFLVYDPNGIDKQIYICNPITNNYKIIPKGYSSDEIGKHGFGVSMAGEYKVIRVLRNSNYLTEIEVYTLGTDQWRNLGRVPNYARAIIDATRPGLALNGRVHWLNCDFIYAFDLDNETVLQIPTPSGEEGEIFPFLGVLKGCLGLLARSQSYDRFSVWVMKEDGIEKSWHKTWNSTEYYTIDCLEYKIWDPKCLIDGINGTSNLIVVDSKTLKLVAYCLETGRVEETKISNDGPYEIMTLMICGPSFVELPNMRSERVHMVQRSKADKKRVKQYLDNFMAASLLN